MKHTIADLQKVNPDFSLDEQWKDIAGYEGVYQVSNKGRIKSLNRYIWQKNELGQLYRRRIGGKIIKPRLQNSGYYVVWFSKNGKCKAFTVHRLVALAFIKNSNEYSDVNHKNGDKKDNRVENLEWCSRSDNIKHAYRELGHPHLQVVVKCLENGEIYNSIREAAIKMSINESGIGNNINGRNKSTFGYHFVKVKAHIQ